MYMCVTAKWLQDWPIDPRKDIPDGAMALNDFELQKLNNIIAQMKAGQMDDAGRSPQI